MPRREPGGELRALPSFQAPAQGKGGVVLMAKGPRTGRIGGRTSRAPVRQLVADTLAPEPAVEANAATGVDSDMGLRPQAFADALKRVSLLSQGRAHGVRMQFTAQELTLVAEDPEHGDAQETLEISFDGDDLTIGFNARYVLDILALVAEDAVEFSLSDDLSPGVIRPAGNPTFTAVVMPMRI